MKCWGAFKHSQKGAAGIEAALVFTLFFGLFYAIVSYSLPMLMVQAFNHAAASGARAAVAVEPGFYGSNTTAYINSGVIPRVREVVAESLQWLPASANQAVLGENNTNVSVIFDSTTGVLTVTVVYRNYANAPLVPTLILPGLGAVPRLPEDLRGMASVAL